MLGQPGRAAPRLKSAAPTYCAGAAIPEAIQEGLPAHATGGAAVAMAGTAPMQASACRRRQAQVKAMRSCRKQSVRFPRVHISGQAAHTVLCACGSRCFPDHPPMHSVQRGVSGIRRYVSWRRRSTKRRLEPPAEVDHKKSTEEETAKKVG